MLERLRWEIEMTAFASDIEKAARRAHIFGLDRMSIGQALCIAAITFIRTEGLAGCEDELLREARRAVPGSEQIPGTGLILS